MATDETSQDPPSTAGAMLETDPLLDMMIRWAEGGLQMGVTLVVGGTLISGRLISTAKYLNDLSQMLGSDASASPASEAASEAYKALAEEFSNRTPTSGPRFYAHLAEARFVGDPKNAFPTAGTVVRIRTDAISGYLIGVLGAS